MLKLANRFFVGIKLAPNPEVTLPSLTQFQFIFMLIIRFGISKKCLSNVSNQSMLTVMSLLSKYLRVVHKMTILHNCFCAYFFLPNYIYLTCTLTKLDNFQILSETICSQNNQLDPVPTYINSLMIFSDESRKGPCNLQCLSRKRYKLNSFRSCTPGMAKLQKPVFEGNDFLGI